MFEIIFLFHRQYEEKTDQVKVTTNFSMIAPQKQIFKIVYLIFFFIDSTLMTLLGYSNSTTVYS